MDSLRSQFKVQLRFVEQLILVVPVEAQLLKSQSQLGTKINHSDLMGTFINTKSPLQTFRFLTGKKTTGI